MTIDLLSRFSGVIPVARLGWTLLHFLWQGTAISLFYGLLRSIFRRSMTAQGRYMLAGAALLALTVAPALTFALDPSREAPGEFAIRLPQPQRILTIAVLVWAAGVVFFSIRLLGGWRVAARLRSASNPPLARWRQTMESLAAALGVKRQVLLLISPLVEVPMVIGWLRPAILVPVEFFTGFPAEHIRALLAHELAHVLRHDYLANILQGLAETVLFYHPAVWWISKQLRAEREKCCDDLAVAVTGDVAAYVRALAELETRRVHPVREAMAANGGSLLERVLRLIEPSHKAAENFPGPAAAWSMTLLWLAGMGAAAMHAAPGRPSAGISGAPLDQPPPARVAMQSPSRRRQAIAQIQKTTRKALLFDPLLSAASRTQPLPVLAEPEGAPALAPSEPGNALAALQGDFGSGAIRPPSEAAGNSGASADSAAPLFRTAARLVLVDVIARGKGSGASALTQDDFTLFDNGKPQNIAFFSPAATLVPRAARGPLAPGSTSNRLEADGSTPANATVLLIDQRNTPRADQLFVFDRLKRFFKSRSAQGPDSKRIGIYTFEPTGALRIVQELTGDNERLVRATNELQPQSPAFAGGFNDPAPRVLEASDVLEAVARHLATVPGRKSLVWLSSGFPADPERDRGLLPDFTPRMEETARVLTDANLAFYAVDARGLLTRFPDMDVAASSKLPWFSPPIATPTLLSLEASSLEGTEAFSRLANLTGGTTFYDTNGIDDSIQNALDDTAVEYTLGFYPSAAQGSPNWHKLKVKVGQRGISVRYREKYFAPAPGLASDDTRRALPALLKGPLDATQLQLTAEASPDRERPGCSRISVSIDLHGLHLENRNNHWVGAVDVSFLVDGSAEAQVIAGNIKIADDQFGAALEKGVLLTGSIPAGAGEGALHVVAQDRATGAAGSLTLPLRR